MPYGINSEAVARELDGVQRMSSERLMTGWFSQMDELVLKMLEAYPQLREAHQGFAEARCYISPRELTDESWRAMKQAVSKLANALRELDNIDIELCERNTTFGSRCGHALLPDGTCGVAWSDWHDDSEQP